MEQFITLGTTQYVINRIIRVNNKKIYAYRLTTELHGYTEHFITKWTDSFNRTWFSPCDAKRNCSWLLCATAKDALRMCEGVSIEQYMDSKE